MDLIPDVVNTAPADPNVFDPIIDDQGNRPHKSMWICDGNICKRQMSSDGLVSDPAADMPDTVFEALGLHEGAAPESSMWICGGHVCKRDTVSEKAA